MTVVSKAHNMYARFLVWPYVPIYTVSVKETTLHVWTTPWGLGTQQYPAMSYLWLYNLPAYTKLHMYMICVKTIHLIFGSMFHLIVFLFPAFLFAFQDVSLTWKLLGAAESFGRFFSDEARWVDV